MPMQALRETGATGFEPATSGVTADVPAEIIKSSGSVEAASVLQASDFRDDVTVFRLNATAAG
jgi:ATP phosphoribosyltransferase